MAERTEKELPLDSIRIDGGTQIRSSVNEETVQEYADKYQEGSEFPPVSAVFDGVEYWLWDGFHRWHASRKAGLGTIRVACTNGTRRDAVLLACGANTAHGLKRSNADKRKAVETLLMDAEWAKWSDRQIADAAGVSHPMVIKIREQLVTVTSCETRIGKDGKERRLPQKPKREPEAGPPVVSEAPSEGPSPPALDPPSAPLPGSPEDELKEREARERLAQISVDELMESALVCANDAIDDLRRIRLDDPRRDEAFDFVANWIKRHKKTKGLA